MKHLRSCSLFAAILALSMNAFSQTFDWPVDPYGHAYKVDASYGPRELGNIPGTFFHKGLDLNGIGGGSTDLNYPILAEADGTIFGIGMTGDSSPIK